MTAKHPAPLLTAAPPLRPAPAEVCVPQQAGLHHLPPHRCRTARRDERTLDHPGLSQSLTRRAQCRLLWGARAALVRG
eukprot:7391780-Prymnesium_polylepis.2